MVFSLICTNLISLKSEIYSLKNQLHFSFNWGQRNTYQSFSEVNSVRVCLLFIYVYPWARIKIKDYPHSNKICYFSPWFCLISKSCQIRIVFFFVCVFFLMKGSIANKRYQPTNSLKLMRKFLHVHEPIKMCPNIYEPENLYIVTFLLETSVKFLFPLKVNVTLDIIVVYS